MISTLRSFLGLPTRDQIAEVRRVLRVNHARDERVWYVAVAGLRVLSARAKGNASNARHEFNKLWLELRTCGLADGSDAAADEVLAALSPRPREQVPPWHPGARWHRYDPERK